MSDQVIEQSEAAKDQSEKVKIKVGGEEKEVTKAELIELAQKGHDYTLKTQKLAEAERSLKAEQERVQQLKGIVDEMNTDPKLKETLNKVYADYKSGKMNDSDNNRDKNLNTIDRLIEEAPDVDTAKSLRQLRQAIQDETKAPALIEKISKLEAEMESIKFHTLNSREERINAEIAKIEEKYGKEIVEKHKQDIIQSAIKYPHQTVSKLLFHFADEDELADSLVKRQEKRKQEELERKKRGTAPGSNSITTPVAKPVDKYGKVNIKEWVSQLKAAGKFSR